MTREGLTEENKATGEVESISSRNTEFSFKGKGKADAAQQPCPTQKRRQRLKIEPEQSAPDTAKPFTDTAARQPEQTPKQAIHNSVTGKITEKSPLPLTPDSPAKRDTGAAERVIDRVDTEKNRHKNKRMVRKANEEIRRKENSPSRLQFTDEERADPALDKYIRKSDKAADKLDAARDSIPKQKRIAAVRTFDEATGKSKVRLHFEETGKPANGKIRHNPLDRPARELNVAVHGEIHRAERENSGVEGAHKTEKLAERAGGYTTRKVKEGYRSHKLKPYRTAAKAEKQAFKANVNVRYQQALRDNPQLAAANPVSKAWQKRKIRRDYAKAVRNGTTQGANAAAGTAKKAAQKATETVQKTAAFTVRHWKGIAVIIAALLIFIFLFSGLSSCGSMLQGGFTSIMGTTYLSQEADMLAAEAAYAAMEAELQYELDNFEALHPGADEYHYQLDGIFHDPHELAAYLSAKYVTYTAGDVQQELRRIFGMQYELSIVETVETRYREETEYDPDTGESYTVSVPYEYKIITVTLKNNGLSSLAPAELTPEQLEMYYAYRETLGNMPLLFGGGTSNTSPSTDLSGVVFINGERPGNQHIVDIAKSQVGNVGGQPYWSWYGFNGRVAWCACFVSWCINQAGYSEPCFAYCPYGVNWFSSRGQWANRSYADIAPGDIIFFDWEGDGTADHVGIVIGTDGTYVYTVEGNSGDACKIRSYPVGGSVILGYGLMNW